MYIPVYSRTHHARTQHCRGVRRCCLRARSSRCRRATRICDFPSIPERWASKFGDPALLAAPCNTICTVSCTQIGHCRSTWGLFSGSKTGLWACFAPPGTPLTPPGASKSSFSVLVRPQRPLFTLAVLLRGHLPNS